MTESVDDKLSRLSRAFDELLGKAQTDSAQSNMERLTQLGLTSLEAKAWLEQEPNYARRNLTGDKSDGDLTEPWSGILKTCGLLTYWFET
jgi:hypothetical protein